MGEHGGDDARRTRPRQARSLCPARGAARRDSRRDGRRDCGHGDDQLRAAQRVWPLVDRLLSSGRANAAAGRAVSGNARMPRDRLRQGRVRDGRRRAAHRRRRGRREVPRAHRLRLALESEMVVPVVDRDGRLIACSTSTRRRSALRRRGRARARAHRRLVRASRRGREARMKLATLRDGGRDGTLVVVRARRRALRAAGAIAPTLQAALDDWARAAPRLARARGARSSAGAVAGRAARRRARSHAPLPRAYEWIDGSALPEPRDAGAQGARRRAARDAAHAIRWSTRAARACCSAPTRRHPARRRRRGGSTSRPRSA